MTEHNDRPAGEYREPDALDRLIADAARDYHTPPATVPREAMWAAIVAARPAGAPVVPVAAPLAAMPLAAASNTPVPNVVSSNAATGARVISLDAERARRRGAWRLAAAAAIFLTTGVGIGRWWNGARQSAPAPVAGTQTAAMNTVPSPDAPAVIAAAPNGTPNAVPSALPNDPATAASRSATPARAPIAVARVPAAERASGPADLYDVALRQHAVKVEALLISYRADSTDVQTDRAVAAWARPLLGDTRLLLDSPASADPRRRRLLEDLEFVLAQMARLAPPTADSSASATQADRAERQFIDGALRRGQLLPRIRTMLPAGTTD